MTNLRVDLYNITGVLGIARMSMCSIVFLNNKSKCLKGLSHLKIFDTRGSKTNNCNIRIIAIVLCVFDMYPTGLY